LAKTVRRLRVVFRSQVSAAPAPGRDNQFGEQPSICYQLTHACPDVGVESYTMFEGKKVVVVMPAYNAEKTLVQTYEEVIAHDFVDLIILVDDASQDKTTEVAKSLKNVKVHTHEQNQGYGGNQKTCYRMALEAGADIVIMVHPDYQYTPKLLTAMTSLIAQDLYPCVLGSRILGGYALKGGMPLWKYIANRFLTLAENILTGAKLSEYHTGYRAFSADVLRRLPLEVNSDDFAFDNQMLVQILWLGCTIGEVTCPTKYFAEASSINFRRSVQYGLSCLASGLKFRFAKMGIKSKLFPDGK
jgi:glycosyltransferase involved in cell wall biosynthesis